MVLLNLILLVGSILVGLPLIAFLAYVFWPHPYPTRTESDYSHHTSPWWEIYYVHKFMCPKYRAEKGSGLEDYFRNQDFHFPGTRSAEPAERLTIGAVGDLMCRKDLLGDGHHYLWNEAGRPLFSSDLSIGNLEFPVNPDCYILRLIRFSVPGIYAEPLLGDGKNGGFDVLTLANNHINDTFHAGIMSTRNFLESRNIPHTGANKTAAEQDNILLVERKGVRIAVLSYTFSTNGVPLEKNREFGTNVVRFNALDERDYDPSIIHRHIAKAKSLGADYIISCHHWGIDLEMYPPERIVRRAHDLMDAGIDLIIGHHTHLMGQIDRYTTKDGRETVIAYSLGNFTAAGQPFTVQRLGGMMHLTLRIDTNREGRPRIYPEEVHLTPLLFTVVKRNGKRSCEVLRVDRSQSAPETTLPLTWKQRRELRKAAALFATHYKNGENGIDYR